MNKRFIFLLASTAALCCGCSCSGNINVLSKYETNGSSLNIASDAFTRYDISYDMTNLNSFLVKLINSIKSQNLNDIKKHAGQVAAEAALLDDKATFAIIKYYSHPTEESKSDYDELKNKFNSYYVKYMEACDEAKKTGNQEIIDFIVGKNRILPSDPQREVELSKIMEDYNEAAEELYNNKGAYSKEQFSKEALKMFLEYAPYCDEYASLFEYEDYLNYSYKHVYNRGYTPADSRNLTDLVKTIIAPKYKPFDFSKYGISTISKIINASTMPFCTKSLGLGKNLDDYASYVGGDYLDVYKNCFTSGYFIFSNDPKSMATAATCDLNYNSNGGILYFSKDYQNYSTIIHEFGHYYSFRINGLSMSKSYDLNETFSQGNEMLFSSYLLNNEKDGFYEGIANLTIDSFYKSLLTIAYSVDIENYLFSNYKTKSIDEMYSYIVNLYNSYNVSDIPSEYWVYPVLVNTGYYISYATSIVESLEILSLANEDFGKAFGAYHSLIAQKEILSEVAAWEKAGLTSPFKEQTIRKIANYF